MSSPRRATRALPAWLLVVGAGPDNASPIELPLVVKR